MNKESFFHILSYLPSSTLLMKKIIVMLSALLWLSHCLIAQDIRIQPYLQDASPNSIYILWETEQAAESIVEWGLTDTLGLQTIGLANASEGDAMIHEVKLENLAPFTKYYYRVKTATSQSEIHHFKTPPLASQEESFRLVAMSDMQRDGAFPDKYREIVEEGVIDYLSTEIGGDLVDNLALVMVPGDLVANGNNYNQWKQQFFDPSQALFSHVPVYPVLGNHEHNSTYYFQYFKMPENGSEGYEEHWWHKDYGNVRIIGLDSNNPFSNQEQLDWLDEVLDLSCDADSIDFVFAQLHHPHKSELWTPGEADYTGDVIARLEQFSTDCGKPSIHFFGHTHAYSRGHSRDHKHLWINAASAGGAIDNWGEFPNFDYDEFAVSHDEYGFVVVEITSGLNPTVHVKRISRGDQDGSLNNVLTDSVVMRFHSSTVNAPIPIFPIDEAIAPECVTLKAGAFLSANSSAEHGQTHWQVSTNATFDALTAESWKNFENWYFDENTQAEDDLTDEKIQGLEENTAYWWRVRYRDRELNWSEWSEATAFQTTASIALPNLVLNPGAEEDLEHWTIQEGVVESLTDGICAGISPYAGERYFAVGGLCEESPVAICTQLIDVNSYADSINAGNFPVHFGAYMSNYAGDDLTEMRLLFLDENQTEISTSNTLSSLANTWTLLSDWQYLPQATRFIQVELKGTRNAGQDNDAYFDEIFVRLGHNEIDCEQMSSSVRAHPIVQELAVAPNPMVSEVQVLLPQGDYKNLSLYMVDAKGVKVNFEAQYESAKVIIKKGNLSSGSYWLWVKDANRMIGRAKLIVL